MTMQMVLKDGTTIDLADASYSGHYVIDCKKIDEFVKVWKKLNSSNAQKVKIVKDGEAVANITNLVITGTQTVTNDDGSFTGHFYTEGEISADMDIQTEVQTEE